MTEEKIRIAELKGYVIKKRCRKEEFKIIEGIANDDKEAIENLIKNFYLSIGDFKEFRFSEISIFDAKRKIYKDYSSLERPIFPCSLDNLVKKKFHYDKETKIAITEEV